MNKKKALAMLLCIVFVRPLLTIGQQSPTDEVWKLGGDIPEGWVRIACEEVHDGGNRTIRIKIKRVSDKPVGTKIVVCGGHPKLPKGWVFIQWEGEKPPIGPGYPGRNCCGGQGTIQRIE